MTRKMAAVGVLAARLAQIRGAKRVIMIDNQAYRLKFVQEKVMTFLHL